MLLNLSSSKPCYGKTILSLYTFNSGQNPLVLLQYPVLSEKSLWIGTRQKYLKFHKWNPSHILQQMNFAPPSTQDQNCSTFVKVQMQSLVLLSNWPLPPVILLQRKMENVIFFSRKKVAKKRNSSILTSNTNFYYQGLCKTHSAFYVFYGNCYTLFLVLLPWSLLLQVTYRFWNVFRCIPKKLLFWNQLYFFILWPS